METDIFACVHWVRNAHESSAQTRAQCSIFVLDGVQLSEDFECWMCTAELADAADVKKQNENLNIN